jgi:hypothetical protein
MHVHFQESRRPLFVLLRAQYATHHCLSCRITAVLLATGSFFTHCRFIRSR